MAAPRDPLAGLTMKQPKKSDLDAKIRTYIQKEYGAEELKRVAPHLNYDLHRNVITQVAQGKVQASQDILNSHFFNYYWLVRNTASRLPLDAGHVGVAFRWEDQRTHQVVASTSSLVELAFTLFNAGVIVQKLNGDHDLAVARKGHLEAAALYEEAARLVSGLPNMPKMLNAEFFTSAQELSLCYAAHCFYMFAAGRASQLDLSKAATECMLLYTSIANRFRQLQLSPDGLMLNVFGFYRAIMEARAHYHLSQHHGKEVADQNFEQIGPQIARLTRAADCLREAAVRAKECRELRSGFESVINFLNAQINTNLAQAQKDNHLAYHQRIPNVSDLPPLQRREGAKTGAISLGDLNFIRTPVENIFAHLVSPQAEEGANRCQLALSAMCNERVQAIVKARGQMKDSVNVSGATAIVASSVPMQAGRGGAGLPDALRARVEAIHSQSCPSGTRPNGTFIERYLLGMVDSINAVGYSVNDIYSQARSRLEAERAEDYQLQQMYGQRISSHREPSDVAARELVAALTDLHSRITRAQQADSTVLKMVQEANVVRVLEAPVETMDSELRALLASMGPAASSGSEADLIRSISQFLNEFSATEAEEENAFTSLRNYLEENKDGLKSVYNRAATQDYPKIEEQQKQKMAERLEELTTVSNKGTAACTALLGSVEQLKKLRSERAAGAAAGQRQYEEKLQAIERACNKSEEVVQYVRQGTNFWNAMSDAVNQMKEQVDGWVTAREIQKGEILNELGAADEKLRGDELSQQLIRDMIARGEIEASS